jgi:hypothetical protein
VKQTLLEIEKNLEARRETDRIMWFSMWIILSIATFGIAWFPMIYYMIKRRNAHFSRQEKLEALILSKLKKRLGKSRSNSQKTDNIALSRNATAWTVSSLLIFPAFYVVHFLKSDLVKHEEHEHDFLAEILASAKESGVSLNIHGFTTSNNFKLGKYLALNVASLGLAIAYWLYRVFNDYNNHFKMQWKIEDELLSFLKTIDKETS